MAHFRRSEGGFKMDLSGVCLASPRLIVVTDVGQPRSPQGVTITMASPFLKVLALVVASVMVLAAINLVALVYHLVGQYSILKERSTVQCARITAPFINITPSFSF